MSNINSKIETREDRRAKYLKILTLSISGGAIYLIPYIRYAFYDFQIQAMGITNQQIGLLSTLYAIGCMALYIPGGMIADKKSAKGNILFSLLGTTILTILFGFTYKNYKISLIIFFLLAFSTAFVFWSSLFKTLRVISGSDEQGRMFGLYYAGNGITGGLVNAIGIWATKFGSDVHQQFKIAIFIYAISTFIATVMVYIFLDDSNENEVDIEEDEFKFSQVKELIKNPIIWAFSLVVLTGYAIYSSTSYFTPYLTDVIGISPEQSGLLTVVRTNFMMLLAPVGGYLADKVFKSTSKWFMVAYAILAVIFTGVLFIPKGANTLFVSLYTLLPGAVGLALYGVVFSIANEADIPITLMGTAVGIASILGYTPDFFMATLFGTWLDKYGISGYTMIFIFLIIMCLVGFISSYYIRKRSKRKEGI